MSNCVFCAIAAGQLPAAKIAETAELICFLPREMEVEGHVLIVPKVHYADLRAVPPVLGQAVFALVQQMAVRCQQVLGADGFNLLNANGVSAQQLVPHLHFHFLPRRQGDGIEAWPKLPGYTGSREELAQRLAFAG